MPEQPPLESLENLPPIDDWEPASLFDDNNAIKKEIAEDVAREVGDEARAEVDRLRTEIMTEVESLDAPPQGGSEWWDTDTWIQGGGGGSADHYFLVENASDEDQKVKVRAGATQTRKESPDASLSAEKTFPISANGVLYCVFDTDEDSWKAFDGHVVTWAASLPAPGEDEDVRLIAEVSGGGDPWLIENIRQAHVGVLRPDMVGSEIEASFVENSETVVRKITEIEEDTEYHDLEPEIALVDNVLKVRMKKIRIKFTHDDGSVKIGLAVSSEYGDWGDGVLTCPPEEEESSE